MNNKSGTKNRRIMTEEKDISVSIRPTAKENVTKLSSVDSDNGCFKRKSVWFLSLFLKELKETKNYSLFNEHFSLSMS